MAAPQKPLNSTSNTIKLLCSYGGKILPRPSDGRLRYSGGLTRVVSVHRSVCFSELMRKLGDLAGFPATLRCKLPSEDLDVLATIKLDEDLLNVIEEYDKASLMAGRELKIRAFLFLPKSSLSSSPSSSSSSSSSSAAVDLSSSNSDRKPTAMFRFPAKGLQYGIVLDCHHHYYYHHHPCHLQAKSSYFSQYSNHWH